jgi:hypothetical protein
MLMKTLFCICVLLLIQEMANAGCLSEKQLIELTNNETKYLSEKIPPAFQHALAEKSVSLSIESTESEGCQAKLLLTLPQADIDEANVVLDAQPAKKIMLSAQGYALPQATKNAAIFSVDANSLTVAKSDISQTAPLGKLRASIELMYALITQKRSEVSDTQTNNTPWPVALTDKVVASCRNKRATAYCQCMAKQYELHIPAQQMAYIQSNEENPYALATGANQGYEELKQKVKNVCKE